MDVHVAPSWLSSYRISSKGILEMELTGELNRNVCLEISRYNVEEETLFNNVVH